MEDSARQWLGGSMGVAMHGSGEVAWRWRRRQRHSSLTFAISPLVLSSVGGGPAYPRGQQILCTVDRRECPTPLVTERREVVHDAGPICFAAFVAITKRTHRHMHARCGRGCECVGAALARIFTPRPEFVGRVQHRMANGGNGTVVGPVHQECQRQRQ